MSSRTGIKVFAQFFGLGPEARRELAPDLRRFDEAEWRENMVEAMGEGRCPWLPELLERVRPLLAEGKAGYADVIDHDAGTLTRYVVDKSGVRSKVLPLDDVVAPYSWSG